MNILRAAAPLSEHRNAIASRVLARAEQPLFAHKCQRDILEHDEFDPTLRAMALAIMQVELLARPLHRRLFEYALVVFAARLRPSLTVGPAQMRIGYLWSADPHCACGCLRATPGAMASVLTRSHYVTRFLSYLESLRHELRTPRRVANAYQKGRDASDLNIPTVYSEVVSALALKYVQHISPAS
jgi:hypothetical protein